MGEKKQVQVEQFDSAKEFLEALYIDNERWLKEKSWDSPWVFRGQKRSEWGLTPKAWRETDNHELQL